MKVALTGNPNSGKTSIFNFLTGASQRVGNWGGVTVEIKEGTVTIDGEKITVVDLPGTYSLSAFTPEEKIARDYLVEKKPDIVVDVVDASNLERNLYLAVQLMELGIQPILAFNMWDEVKAKGSEIDIGQLGRLLGATIIPTVGKNGTGVRDLMREALRHVKSGDTAHTASLSHFPRELSAKVESLAAMDAVRGVDRYAPWWVAMKLFEDDSQVERLVAEQEGGSATLAARDRAAREVADIWQQDTECLIAEARYGYIAGAIKETVRTNPVRRVETSDMIDRVLTHPVWAYPVFVVFMWILFQATFVLGAYPMAWIGSIFGLFERLVADTLSPGAVRDLITEGVIGGVGGVAVFLPNILILFFGISIMEDTGYMARAAFIMDKLMHKIGLHGRSFIPMLMGMGCSVPAILAARTLESKEDRTRTILLTPLISCSARLPVYVLFAGAMFPRHAGNVVFLFQFVLGTLAFFFMGFLFKHTLFRGKDHPFVMELPPYRLPTLRSIVIHMWQKAEHYLKKMGGVVLVFSVILWFAGTYPRSQEVETRYQAYRQALLSDRSPDRGAMEEKLIALAAEEKSERMAGTAIGRIGRAFEPVVRPIGSDWRGAVSILTGFVAKEIVVGSMGVLYAVGEADADSGSLRARIAENFTPLSAIAFMLFILLYTPCIVAFVTIVRELRSWKWSLFSLGYQVLFAWSAAFVVYQGGRLIGLQ